MDLQFWLYVIIVVITLLARAGKKKARPAEAAPKPPRPEFNPAPMTFEDLLREIQESKKPKEEPVPIREPNPYEVEDNLPEEAREPLEQTTFTEASTYDVYEQAKRDAFNRVSLEESMKLEDTEVRYGKFREYERTEEPKAALSGILADFKNPEGFKRAFIMSELLKRKF
jgi:hypothetical protein